MPKSLENLPVPVRQIGQRIATARKATNLTAEEIARRCANKGFPINVATVRSAESSAETGRNPSFATVAVLLEVLGLPWAALDRPLPVGTEPASKNYTLGIIRVGGEMQE
jgi:transcriptional regulator with XRE-family HTH domain